MLLHDARRAARFRDGELVPLDDQDRSLWDQQQIAEGRALLQRATRGTGPYLLQAAIADLHLHQPRDWDKSPRCTRRSPITGSPIVEINRAIAVAEIDGPDAGLTPGPLDLDHYRYFHSTRADLLRRPAATARRGSPTHGRSGSPMRAPSNGSLPCAWPSCRRHPTPTSRSAGRCPSRVLVRLTR